VRHLTRFCGLALVVAALVAFGAAVGGELVWDDPSVVGVAAALRSPFHAFSKDLFGLGASAEAGAGASYFRPLVMFAYAVELRLFSTAPEFGLHFFNLLWHALAAWLVWRALARWTGASSHEAELACWLGALVWTVLPAKAENVAWISGRADSMGLSLLLLGLEARRKVPGRAARAVAAGAAVLLALLCKETFVAAPAIVALEVSSEGVPLGRALRAPDVLAGWGIAAAYLFARRLLLPLHGGGVDMFLGLSIGDRIALALETIGHALRALVIVPETHLLRGPIGFSGPFVLRRDPLMGGIGAIGLVVLALLVRAPRWRPALLLLGVTLLPIANVVPAGLESRMNDRFLYVPSLAIALAISLLLAGITGRLFRVFASMIAVLGALLLGLSIRRSMLFESSDALWSWERAHGDRAASVLENAANAAERAARFEAAREGFLETAARYEELGFAEGFPFVMRALHAQWEASGASDVAFLEGYRGVLRGLLAKSSARVSLPLRGRSPIVLGLGSPEARAFAEERGELIVAWLSDLPSR
jgi:hypothetical protein